MLVIAPNQAKSELLVLIFVVFIAKCCLKGAEIAYGTMSLVFVIILKF
jgi:hypothetical protein